MQTPFVSNEKRKRILDYLLSNPNERIQIRKIASKLKLNPGFVSTFVSKLKNSGIVRTQTVDLNSPLTRAWKIMINIEAITPMTKKIVKQVAGSGIGIYGSWAKGTNTEKSDLDIWIKVKKYPEDIKIARMRSEVRKKTGTEPSILFITNEKMDEFGKNNPSLYFSLINSFHLWGEHID